MEEYKELYRSLAGKSASDLSLYSAGAEQCTPGYGYGPKVRAYHLIHFVRKGSGRLFIAGNDLRIAAGDAFVIPAGMISYYESSMRDPWEYAWVGFLGTSSRAYLSRLSEAAGNPYVLRRVNVDLAFNTIRSIVCLKGDSLPTHLRGTGLLYELLADLGESVGISDTSGGTNDVAEAARLIIEMEFSEPLQVSGIAKRVGVHPNYLSRCFSEAFGKPPKRFILDTRLERAKRLLAETGSSVGTIAKSVGFTDQLSFSRAFHNAFGMSPTAYRASIQDGSVSLT